MKKRYSEEQIIGLNKALDGLAPSAYARRLAAGAVNIKNPDSKASCYSKSGGRRTCLTCRIIPTPTLAAVHAGSAARRRSPFATLVRGFS